MKALLPAFFAVVSTLSAAIVEQPLEYKAGEILCEGWQAYDDAVSGKRAAFERRCELRLRRARASVFGPEGARHEARIVRLTRLLAPMFERNAAHSMFVASERKLYMHA